MGETQTSFRWYSRADIAACHGVLDGARLHEVACRAWADIASGTAYGLKSTISVSASELPEHKGLKRPVDLPERLGWKLSCLSSVNRTYGSVKIVGANALNRQAGLPRSSSTILLLDKLTMTPLCAMDATDVSAARTASYATVVMERFYSVPGPSPSGSYWRSRPARLLRSTGSPCKVAPDGLPKTWPPVCAQRCHSSCQQHRREARLCVKQISSSRQPMPRDRSSRLRTSSTG